MKINEVDGWINDEWINHWMNIMRIDNWKTKFKERMSEQSIDQQKTKGFLTRLL